MKKNDNRCQTFLVCPHNRPSSAYTVQISIPFLLIVLKINTRSGVAADETRLQDKVVKFQVPSSWCLFKPLQAFQQLAHIVWKVAVGRIQSNKTRQEIDTLATHKLNVNRIRTRTDQQVSKISHFCPRLLILRKNPPSAIRIPSKQQRLWKMWKACTTPSHYKI
jgi:hypothetical protein